MWMLRFYTPIMAWLQQALGAVFASVFSRRARPNWDIASARAARLDYSWAPVAVGTALTKYFKCIAGRDSTLVLICLRWCML